MQCREPRNYVRIAGDTSKPVDVILDTNYADHPLVVGPRYIPEDVRGFPLKKIGVRTSGVCRELINFSRIHTNVLTTVFLHNYFQSTFRLQLLD